MNKYLKSAYTEAKKAYKMDEVPVGAVIVKDGKVIARAYNKKESTKDPLGHAEILAIKKACKKLNTWHLDDCEMYVTLEPCTMCVGAIVHSRIKTIYYGALDSRFGAIEGSYKLLEIGKFNHYPKTIYLEDKECSKILSEYFRLKRNKS